MKSLPAELTAELAKESIRLAHLFKITLTGSTHRYTDADIDIYYGGNWWISKGITFDAVRISVSPKVDSISFEIDNVDKAFSSIVLSEETRGKPCEILRVALNVNMAVIGAGLLFLGQLDAIEIDHKRASIKVFNHFIRWKMPTPRRVHSATCQWTFKSNHCGYSGPGTWCDHSWPRCVELNNKLNFSGFRWLPYLVDKQIWWGRAPK